MEQTPISLSKQSEAVHQMLGKAPSWIIRWGVLASVFGIACLFFMAWVVRIPTTVEGVAEASLDNVPSDIRLDRSTYHFIPLLAPGDSFRTGDWLMVKNSEANPLEVRKLENWLGTNLESLDWEEKEWRLPPISPAGLGQLRSWYERIRQSLDVHHNLTDEDFDAKALETIEEQIKAVRNRVEILRAEKARKEARLNKVIESLQEAQQAGNRSDYTEQQAYFTQQRDDLKEDIRDLEWDIQKEAEESNRLEQWKQSLQQQRLEKSFDRLSGLRTTMQEVKKAVMEWKNQHLLVAPFDGWIEYKVGTLRVGRLYKNESPRVLATLHPLNTREQVFAGRLRLLQPSRGKVEEGQSVLIHVEGYPPHTFGLLKATIATPPYQDQLREDGWWTDILLDPSLTTTAGKTIPYQKNLKGRGEIIVNEKRFLHILFDRLW